MGVARSWKWGAGGEETTSLATSNLRKIVTLFSFCFTSAYMLQQQQRAGKHFLLHFISSLAFGAKELTKNGGVMLLKCVVHGIRTFKTELIELKAMKRKSEAT